MNKKIYYVQMEVAGDFAMFSRPDSGSNPTSCCIPTISAAKGMFESVFFMKSAAVIPVECKICSEEIMCDMPYNSHSPLAKGKLIKDEMSTRIIETVLFKPVFQLTAIIVPSGFGFVNPAFRTTNIAHAYEAQFVRHLNRGDFRVSVNLGQEYMITSYTGPFREDTRVNENINRTVRNVTVTMFDKLVGGTKVSPMHKDVVIKNGVADYLSLEEVYQLVSERC